MRRVLRHDHTHIPLLYVFSVLALLATVRISVITTHHVSIKKEAAYPQKNISTIVFDKTVFASTTIQGEAFIIYDGKKNEVIAEKNSTKELPLASITKVMTAITALKYHNKVTPITIQTNTIDAGLDFGLKKNQEWQLAELLKYTLVFSSNDAALIIASSLEGEGDFVKKMTEDATILGFPSVYTNPAGLDEKGGIGGIGSAYSVAKMILYAQKLYPELFDATTKPRATLKTESGTVGGIPNTNQRITNIAEALASKTGYTDSAGGNLAIVVDISPGYPVAIVVLGSTREERFRDVEILYKTLKESIK
jgi:D-alanyl-D-alanine carboxypeptidase